MALEGGDLSGFYEGMLLGTETTSITLRFERMRMRVEERWPLVPAEFPGSPKGVVSVPQVVLLRL